VPIADSALLSSKIVKGATFRQRRNIEGLQRSVARLGRVHQRAPAALKTSVVFDFGGVLIDWDPRHLYRKLLPDDASIETFLSTVCTSQWNEQLDAGRPWSEAVDELSLRVPHQRTLIEAYWKRWPEMMRGTIAGSVAVADELRRRGVPMYGLTNWSAETFPYAQRRFDFLAWFSGIVVSGVEGVIKPSPEIFRILIERFDLRTNDIVFIDDNPANVEAARALGIDSHRFHSAENLRRYLVEHRLL
jgi:2-haloacid dehalogenase